MSKVRCPICDAAMPGNRKDYPDYPFCSRRCRMIDLGRWLGEGYRVPGPPAENVSTLDETDDDDTAR